MPLTPALVEAYRAADYVVHEPRIAIRVGEANAELEALLAASANAAFLTAANPGSERRSGEENGRLLAGLRQALDAMRLRYREGEGRDPKRDWPGEPSFLVLGIRLDEALDLARRFGQNAFVWCERGAPPRLVLAAKWRLVLDTHVWLDWLAFDDPSVAPLKAAVAADRAEIYLDAPCEAELERVLGYPIARRVAARELQVTRLAEARRMARRPERELEEGERASLPRCSDPDDQKFLELALAARAGVLLTRDRALLQLARRVPFAIIPPASFRPD
jgi:predicted nucleic acid-binding protein